MIKFVRDLCVDEHTHTHTRVDTIMNCEKKETKKSTNKIVNFNVYARTEGFLCYGVRGPFASFSCHLHAIRNISYKFAQLHTWKPQSHAIVASLAQL